MTLSDVDPPSPLQITGCRYKLLKPLGKGTYGQVLSATDMDSGDLVAVKRVFFNYLNDYLFLFFREISILKSLNHSSILPIRDVVSVQEGCIWIITPLYDSDLRSYIRSQYPRNRRVPMEDVRILFYQIVQGTAYCHSMHVLHRDLKPQNILIDHKTKQIRIADFGLSNRIQIESSLATIISK